MDKKQIEELIQKGRAFMKPTLGDYPDYESDQELHKPQPPLVKASTYSTLIS